MQEKQIPFNGITLTPYSDISPDGQLSDSQDLELYNGALRPSTINGKKYSGFDGYNLIYIHTTGNYEHYIFTKIDEPRSLFYKNKLSDKDYIVIYKDMQVAYNLTSIGNTLIINTISDGILYLLYTMGKYQVLGKNIPDIDLSFYLTMENCMRHLEYENLSGKQLEFYDDYFQHVKINDTFKTTFTTDVISLIDAIKTNRATANNKFTNMFYVSYSLVLYDDSEIMHSLPVLMIPASEANVKIAVRGASYTKDTDKTYIGVTLYMPYFTLHIKPHSKLTGDFNALLENWKDIVKSIRIYVTPQHTRLDRNGVIEETSQWQVATNNDLNIIDDLKFDNDEEFSILHFDAPEIIIGENPTNSINLNHTTFINHSRALFVRAYIKDNTKPRADDYPDDNPFAPYVPDGIVNPFPDDPSQMYFSTAQFKVPLKDHKDFQEELMNESVFYKISELDIEDLIEEGVERVVPINDGVLTNLSQQDKCSFFDFSSRKNSSCKNLMVYNKRLIKYSIRESRKFNLSLNQPYCDSLINFKIRHGYLSVFPFLGTVISEDKGNSYTDIFILNKLENENFIIRYYNYPNIFLDHGIFHFFYPDIDAYKAIIYHEKNGEKKCKEISLTEHPFMDGAQWISSECKIEILSDESKEHEYTLSEPEALTDYLTNEIHVSEVNNPFLFPLEGKIKAGTGTILALSSIVKPLSQGQYGQYPIMALCTDGNYALQIDDTGLIIAAPPMQRDVCINPQSVTTIDGAIIYVSEQGVMMADGNDIHCISSQLTGVTDTFTDEENSVTIRPMDLFRKCNTIFDYANQRLIFFDPTNELQYALTYSLSSGTWNNITVLDFIKAINIYPYSYIQDKNGNIILIDQSYDFQPTQQHIEGKIITRPLKLDTLQLKRLTAFALQGIFSAKQQITLYGSNDAVNWRHLGTTQRAAVNNISGRTYKYFRFVIQTKLTPQENITGLRIQYEVRPEKRLR